MSVRRCLGNHRDPDWRAGSEGIGWCVGPALEPVTLSISIFEAVPGFCRKRRTTVAQGQRVLLDFLDTAGIRTAAITERQEIAALSPLERYGKGRGHPAQLNMGDCLSYAVADVCRVPLLFKSGDSGRTDIQVAWAPLQPPSSIP